MKRSLRRTWTQARNRTISGILVVVPLAITVVVLRFVLGFLQDTMRPLANVLRQHLALGGPPGAFDWITPTLAGMIVLGSLFLIGTLATHVVGRRVISASEGLLRQIPGVGAVYSAARQVVDAITGNRKNAFHSVVEIHMFGGDNLTIGFVTASLQHEGAEKFVVFVPTAPNPMSGFLVFVRQDACKKLDISVEDALKLIVSVGLLSNSLLPQEPEKDTPREGIA